MLPAVDFCLMFYVQCCVCFIRVLTVCTQHSCHSDGFHYLIVKFHLINSGTTYTSMSYSVECVSEVGISALLIYSYLKHLKKVRNVAWRVNSRNNSKRTSVRKHAFLPVDFISFQHNGLSVYLASQPNPALMFQTSSIFALDWIQHGSSFVLEKKQTVKGYLSVPCQCLQKNYQDSCRIKIERTRRWGVLNYRHCPCGRSKWSVLLLRVPVYEYDTWDVMV